MNDPIIFQSLVTQNNMPFSAIFEVVTSEFETTYIGYAKKGTSNFDDETFSVCRIQKNLATGVTTCMWANGSLERKFAFSNPSALNYSFLK